VFLEPAKATVGKYGLTKGSYTDKKVPITQDMVRQFEDVVIKAWKEQQKTPETHLTSCAV